MEKPQATTTKVRPVFNGTFAVKGRKSLNDCVYKGSWPQTPLVGIVLAWRLHRFCAFGDIKKAFLKIRIAEEDRLYLRYLWFEGEELKVFELTSVLFGCCSSPYMLWAVLFELFKDTELPEFPTSIYMDDALIRSESEDDLIRQIGEVTRILARGSFELHKWATAHWLRPALLPHIAIEESEMHRALGVSWRLSDDQITFPAPSSPPVLLTRRKLASWFGAIFDPMGLLGPLLMLVRLFMRKVVLSDAHWDTPLEAALESEARELFQELLQVPQFTFPRFVRPNPQSQLHVFADASFKAYGTCLYVCDPSTGQSQLLYSRSRLSSESRTIPQLELCAAVLAAEVYDNLRAELGEFVAVRFFTDSTITLARIQSSPNRLPAFEANRVRIIREKTPPMAWSHLVSGLNPADPLSRGLTAAKLLSSTLWRHGPTLSELEPANPVPAVYTLQLVPRATQAGTVEMDSRLLGLRFRQVLCIYEQLLEHMLCRAPTMLERINAGKQAPKSIPQLAMVRFWQLVQGATLEAELECVRNGKKLPKGTQLWKNPQNLFIDEWGLLRYRRARLEKAAELSPEEIYPVVFVKHPLAHSYILHLHQGRLRHAKVESLRAFLNRHHLFVGGTQTIRTIVAECLHCNRQDGRPFQAFTAPLPLERLSPGRAFDIIGLDIFGPIFTSTVARGAARSRKAIPKFYGLIFTCANSRAVHLELLLGKDTCSILHAFRRFASRRGRPSIVYSDNEPSFAASARVFHHLRDLRRELEREHSFRWRFNPPYAPTWGGFWERLVGVVKSALKQFKPQRSYTIDEMQTFLIEAEALVNSRPLLTHNREVPSITPAHLAIGRPLLDLAPVRIGLEGAPGADDALINYNSLLIKLNAFWRVWTHEYLLALREHYSASSRAPVVGELVIVEWPNQPRGEWPLATIHELHPGRDGMVRAATVKRLFRAPHESEYLTRTVQRLIPLEATRAHQREEAAAPAQAAAQ